MTWIYGFTLEEAQIHKWKPIGKLNEIRKRVKDTSIHFQYKHRLYRPGFVYPVLIDGEEWLYYDFEGEAKYDSCPHYPPGDYSGVGIGKGGPFECMSM